MRTYCLFVNLSIAMFLLTSCSSNNLIHGQSDTLEPPVSASEKTPTAFIVPQPSPTHASHTCPALVNDLPQNITSNVIVLWDQKGAKTGVFLWDIALGKRKDLPGESERSFPPNLMVSPDHRQLAYFEYLKNPENTLDPVRLSVADSEGNVIVTLDNTWENWTGLVGWLDNNQLLLDQFVSGNPHPTVLLNPFTNNSSVIVADYPEIHRDMRHFMGWWGDFATTMAIYDSSLDLVIYPISNSTIVLFDKRWWSEITRIDIGNVTGSAPQWSPDNQRFAVDISSRGNDPYASYYSDELYVVDRNGQKNKLTDFAKTFTSIDIQEYAWSPDGQHIAFWYNTRPLIEDKYELAILDITSKKVTTYCIADYIRDDALKLFPPIWSPDGIQLLVRGWYSTNIKLGNSEESNIFLVDINKNFVSKIAENAVPLGWMLQY